MSISLTIKYSKSEEQVPNFQAYTLKVEVLASTDMTSKIFVFQRRVISANDPTLEDYFMCIADPIDIEEFPEDNPNMEQNVPYYRTDNVLIKFRSMVELEETKALIGEDIQGLIDAMKAEGTVPETEEIIYV
ncbi:hypothetical protein ACFLQL_00315 [Verrucomicrobiota bacterium]